MEGNGQKSKEARLTPGDHIQVGNTILDYEQITPTAVTPTPSKEAEAALETLTHKRGSNPYANVIPLHTEPH